MPDLPVTRSIPQSVMYEGNSIGSISCVKVKVHVVPVNDRQEKSFRVPWTGSRRMTDKDGILSLSGEKETDLFRRYASGGTSAGSLRSHPVCFVSECRIGFFVCFLKSGVN